MTLRDDEVNERPLSVGIRIAFNGYPICAKLGKHDYLSKFADRIKDFTL